MSDRLRYALGRLFLSLACALLSVSPGLAHGRIDDGHGQRVITNPVAAPKSVRVESVRAERGRPQAKPATVAAVVAAQVELSVEAARSQGDEANAGSREEILQARIASPVVGWHSPALARERLADTASDGARHDRAATVVASAADNSGNVCCPDGHGCCCQGASSCCSHATALHILDRQFTLATTGWFRIQMENFAESLVVAPADRPPAFLV